MKRTIALCCFAATAALWIPASGESGETALGNQIVSGDVAASELELRGVVVGSDGSITGTVFNGSGRAVRDVELLVSHTWSWNDERHPGEDNPGRASLVRVSAEIPPGSAATFSYVPSPPLMQRAEGSFHTTAAVQSFTEVGS